MVMNDDNDTNNCALLQLSRGMIQSYGNPMT